MHETLRWVILYIFLWVYSDIVYVQNSARKYTLYKPEVYSLRLLLGVVGWGLGRCSLGEETLIPPCTSRARKGQWPQSVYAGIFRLPINVVQGIAQVFSMQFSRGAKTCLSCHRWCPCVDHVVLKLFQLLIGVVNLLHDTNLGSWTPLPHYCNIVINWEDPL